LKIQPMGTRLYVILDAVSEKQVGSIILPGKHVELTRLGTVQAIGSEVTNYKVGDRVMMGFQAGRVINPVTQGFNPADETHRIVAEEEIYALVTE
jgi:co-chaperonin GroES (HSP10)